MAASAAAAAGRRAARGDDAVLHSGNVAGNAVAAGSASRVVGASAVGSASAAGAAAEGPAAEAAAAGPATAGRADTFAGAAEGPHPPFFVGPAGDEDSEPDAAEESAQSFSGPRLALWAVELRLAHPVTGEPLCLRLPRQAALAATCPELSEGGP